ncbi:Uncharacterised protein [uncultured archaeon]|nr:Uncharacterised protein [uncultured archaeon]
MLFVAFPVLIALDLVQFHEYDSGVVLSLCIIVEPSPDIKNKK